MFSSYHWIDSKDGTLPVILAIGGAPAPPGAAIASPKKNLGQQ